MKSYCDDTVWCYVFILQFMVIQTNNLEQAVTWINALNINLIIDCCFAYISQISRGIHSSFFQFFIFWGVGTFQNKYDLHFVLPLNVNTLEQQLTSKTTMRPSYNKKYQILGILYQVWRCQGDPTTWELGCLQQAGSRLSGEREWRGGVWGWTCVSQLSVSVFRNVTPLLLLFHTQSSQSGNLTLPTLWKLQNIN